MSQFVLAVPRGAAEGTGYVDGRWACTARRSPSGWVALNYHGREIAQASSPAALKRAVGSLLGAR